MMVRIVIGTIVPTGILITMIGQQPPIAITCPSLPVNEATNVRNGIVAFNTPTHGRMTGKSVPKSVDMILVVRIHIVFIVIPNEMRNERGKKREWRLGNYGYVQTVRKQKTPSLPFVNRNALLSQIYI